MVNYVTELVTLTVSTGDRKDFPINGHTMLDTMDVNFFCYVKNV